jgi:hypothetical protein
MGKRTSWHDRSPYQNPPHYVDKQDRCSSKIQPQFSVPRDINWRRQVIMLHPLFLCLVSLSANRTQKDLAIGKTFNSQQWHISGR